MAKAPTKEINILKVEIERATFHLLGTTPLIMHRMAEKAKRELLLPKRRMTAADKATNLKHDPLEEYRASMYQRTTGPTALVFPAAAFHKSIADAALDIPGAKKAQIGRLCGVEEFHVAIYGVPQMFMNIVRMADMNRTPDVRTRAILPQWACSVTVRYTKPLVRVGDITSLMAAAGIFIGIGDNRQQKGSGSFGLWQVVDEDERDFAALLGASRKAQEAAIKSPAFYDAETEELFGWYNDEIGRRNAEPAPKRKGRNGSDVAAQAQQ